MVDSQTQESEDPEQDTDTKGNESVEDNGIMLAVQNTAPSSETCGTINYYAFINGQATLIESKTDATVYYWSSSGRRYISSSDLESVYGYLGFEASMMTDGTYYFPHEKTGSSTNVWGDANVESYNSTYYSPIIAESTMSSSVDVYYRPSNPSSNSSAITVSSLANTDSLYTVTVSDPEHLVYDANSTDLPKTIYTLVGNTASITVNTKDGVRWVCKGTDGSTVNGTNDDNGTVTFTIGSISQAYTITAKDTSKVYVTYDLNLPKTPIDSVYGTPTVGGSSTTYTEAVVSGENYSLESPSITTYYYQRGTKWLGSCTFLGWSTSKTATTAEYKAGDSMPVTGDQKLYAVWETKYGDVEVPNGSIVNFFVSLNAVPEGTTGWSGSIQDEDFTTSVYMMDCGVTCEQVSENLYSANKDTITYSNNQYTVLGGTSGTDLNATHNDIVSKLTNGYALADSDGNTYTFKGTFPTDEEVLRTIRTMVSNGKEITLNGKTMTVDQLTAQNFTIKWYVFKTGSDDAWHIDGILVARTGTLKVVKTFGGNATAVAQVKEDFVITVNGTDTSLKNDNGIVNKTMTLNLKEYSDTNPTGYSEYDSTTDTYTWYVKADQFYKYAVTESNYSYGKNNISAVTEYEITNSVYEDENTNGWKTYEGSSTKIDVTVTGQTYDPDDTSSMETVSFLNTYTDPGTLIIQKKDAATGALLPNVQFKVSMNSDESMQLYQTSDNHYTSDSTTDGAELVRDNIVATDAKGCAYLTIAQGTYYLEEITDKYNNPGQITVTVANGSAAGVTDKIVAITDAFSENKDNNGKSYVSYTDNTLILNVTNVSPTTSVTLKKNWTDNENSPVTFQLYRNGESMGPNYLVTLDGTTDDKETTPWQVTFNDLPLYVDGALATYSLRETNIGGSDGFNYSIEYPDGYKYYDVTVSKAVYYDSSGNVVIEPDGAKDIENVTITCSNNRSTAEVYFNKQDTNGDAVKGAEFYLYKLNDSTSQPDGDVSFIVTNSGDNSIVTQTLEESTAYSKTSKATSGDDGKVSFGSRLSDGYYYLIEHSTPRGYVLAEKKLYLVYKDGSDVTIYEKTNDSWNALRDLKITNDTAEFYADITINKIKEGTAIPLPGAKFTLKNSGGKYYTVTDNEIAWEDTTYELVTDNLNGQFKLKLPKGTYTLTETSPPVGYEPLKDSITIEVDDQGQVISFKIGNTEKVSSGTQSISPTGYTSSFDVENTSLIPTITVKKQVTGNMGDKSKEFTFTIKTETGTLSVPSGGNCKLSDDGKTATAYLHDGASAMVKVPDNANITITETDADGYTTTYQIDTGSDKNGTTCTLTDVTANQTVVFTNNKTVTVDSGVFTDSKPYIIIASIVSVAMICLWMRHKKHYET